MRRTLTRAAIAAVSAVFISAAAQLPALWLSFETAKRELVELGYSAEILDPSTAYERLGTFAFWSVGLSVCVCVGMLLAETVARRERDRHILSFVLAGPLAAFAWSMAVGGLVYSIGAAVIVCWVLGAVLGVATSLSLCGKAAFETPI